MVCQAVKHLPVIGARGRRLIDHNDVQTCYCCLMLAKRLPNYTLNAISRRRLATVFLRDRQTEPGYAFFVLPAQHCKKFIPAP